MNEVLNPLGISPTIFSIGWPFHIELRWYGVMYLLGYTVGYALLKKLVRKGFIQLTQVQVDNLIFTLAMGMVIGARITYCLVYDYDQWIQAPLSLFYINRGGLSFHGAVVGMALGAYFFARKNNINWMRLTDVIALAGTPGLFFGRIGNFINGELFGRESQVPWAMHFPLGGNVLRHPSMLYEGLMEGVVLSLLLWYLLKKVKVEGQLSAVFLGGYAISRFIVEFFRQPDEQLGFYFGIFTMGQILCFLMLFVAYAFWITANKKAVKI